MKELISLVNHISSNNLKVDLQLLTKGIYVPRLSEEFDTFSIQGNLHLNSNCSKVVKKICIQFRGSIDRLKKSENLAQKALIIENQMELLKSPIHISKGDTTLSFELALPKNLPPSVNSEYFKVNYTMIALIELEDTKTPYNFPVKVYNHYLIPNYELMFETYNTSGAINKVMDYSINFPKRFFSKDELIPFKTLLQPKNNTKLIYITAKLVQKVNILNDTTQTPLEERPRSTELSRETVYLQENLPEYDLEFFLPIQKLSNKFILPTLDASYFEVYHQIELIFNYQLEGSYLTKYCSIRVPLAITTQLRNSLEDLPDYTEIEDSSLLPINELPPIYSV